MLEQISLFDEKCNADNGQDNVKLIIQEEPTLIPYVGQKVKIKVPEDENCEIYQYLKGYCSSLLSKVGEIQEIKLYPSGKYTCTVNFLGDIVLLNPENLYLL
ncbi:hypothetical protein ACOMCU_25170 [Lysinibacillus sp. UGB7]|uniref:hypothetical protein n=1 Tax=Lysinibacillus sp. UGB7 TaxID=3411039 RepID=UPI003B786CC2